MKIKEGKVELEILKGFEVGPGSISPGFYNREMETSRDFSVSLLNLMNPGVALDSMGGTGIRGLRFASETKWKVVINDVSKTNSELIRKNALLNGLDLEILNLNYFSAVSTRKWDYIDIDPYGSPAGFIEAGLMNMRNNGIIGVTMTDTANLEGKSLVKGKRIYGGLSQRGKYSKEISTRIFIRWLLERGASLGFAGIPLLSIREKHYIRTFIQFRKGSKISNDIESKFECRKVNGESVGPMYIGQIYDPSVISGLKTEGISRNSINLMKNFKNEDLMFLFYTNENGKEEIKLTKIIEKLIGLGYAAGRTNFYEKGIKTNAPDEVMLNYLRSI